MNKQHLAVWAALSLTLASCKKEHEPDPAPDPAPAPPSQGTVRLSFAFMNGDDAFDMSATYQDGAGHGVRFSKLKFYVSDIHLSDDAGNEVAEFHDTYLLVDASAAENLFTLGSIDPAHVHEAHLTLGLEPDVNHADPLTAEFPLDQPDMHWSWNPTQGYKFLNMEGKVDGNDDGDFDDAEDVEFTYHCATDDLLREAHVHIHADVDAGATETMAAKVDVGILISGLDFAAVPMAMGGGPENVTAMDSLVTSIAEVE
jgi:hypothetical protein